MRVLENAAASYFGTSPDQNREGNFDDIIRETRSLWNKRHHIAHGMVRGIMVYGERDAEGLMWPTMQYVVMPPEYAVFNLTKSEGRYYHYGSKEIHELADKFAQCATRAREFSELLSPP